MTNIDPSFNTVNKSDKKVFLTLAADYGNIGDVALTIAQEKIIRKVFPDRKIIEIPMINAYDYENAIKEILNDDDICTIIGGGNMGNVYLGFEERRRFIVEVFKNNKIISFPQSIDFLDNEEGKKEFQKSIDVYASHSDLTIFAREQKSFDIMKTHFKNKVYLVPDSVLYLAKDFPDNTTIRNNITLCLRNDTEKIIHSNTSDNLIRLLNSNHFDAINIIDTYIGEVSISSEEKVSFLNNMLTEFQKSKVVITDRLHGMIFCVITNTPCIAFDNSNQKISSTYYTWLKNVPSVKLLENNDEKVILENIQELYHQNHSTHLNLEKDFDPLFSALQ